MAPSSPPDCLTPHTAEESVLGVQVSHIDTSLKCMAPDVAAAAAASVVRVRVSVPHTTEESVFSVQDFHIDTLLKDMAPNVAAATAAAAAAAAAAAFVNPSRLPNSSYS